MRRYRCGRTAAMLMTFVVATASACARGGASTPEEAVRGALEALAHGNHAGAERFLMTAEACRKLHAAPTCEDGVKEMHAVIDGGGMDIDTYTMESRDTDDFGRPIFAIDMRTRPDRPFSAHSMFTMYAQEVDGRYYAGWRAEHDVAPAPSAPVLDVSATPSASPAPTIAPAASAVSRSADRFTVAELIERYSRDSGELRGKKVTVTGQYMGTDNWTSRPVAIGIVTDASAETVVSVTCFAMKDLEGANPGDAIEVRGELVGDGFPSLTDCVARKR